MVDGNAYLRALRVLGLSGNPTMAEIKKAYKRLALRTHPDRGGDEGEFKRVQAAYEEAVEHLETGSANVDHSSGSPREEKGLEIGDRFFVRQLFFDRRPYRGEVTAQLVLVEQEVLIALTLGSSWERSSGRVLVALSEGADDEEVALYDREVVQRSMEHSKNGAALTGAWFSPFEVRMRIDGYPVGQEPPEEDVRFRRAWWRQV